MKPKHHLFAPEGVEVYINGERVYAIKEIAAILKGGPINCDTCKKYHGWGSCNDPNCNIDHSGWEPRE